MTNIVFTKRLGVPYPEGFTGYNDSDQTIPKGLAINAYNKNGILCIRLADNRSMATECHGFAWEDILPKSYGRVINDGQISNLVGANPADLYFLGENGQIVNTAPFSPPFEDRIIQIVGMAVSSTTLEINIEQPVGINLPMPPAAPILLDPDDGEILSTNIVTFLWEMPGGEVANMYHLQISRDNTFATIDDEYPNLTSTSKIVNVGFTGTGYWRVRARNYAFWGAWSDIRSFTI